MNVYNYSNLVPEVHYFIHRKCTPEWCITPMTIPFTDFTYVVKGAAVYHINDKTYIAKAGDIIYIPKGSRRQAECVADDLMECYAVNLMFKDTEGQDVKLPLDTITNIRQQPKVLEILHELEEVWTARESGYQLKARGLACLYVAEVMSVYEKRLCEQADPRITETIKYMKQHYKEPLTITGAAEHYGLHPNYYGNIFKKITGVSFNQKLMEIRLEMAKNMLYSGEYNVSKVAAECGFSDIYYFSKVFKKSVGVNPSILIPGWTEAV
ncbi:AraC family transcriptional regulator [Oribacterium sp. WCC10]|uniref:AraC family transcriptional regulator n=1 Tax=Oribacterium sp. WCC10 TaxID=1855343 RepID=UPI0008E06EE8|nr:AraC family transcriptional regulator [Oribacterium sp. WCC10]SFG20502.1 AraC-type DNA-binding protein [Oribacterium sp. WCC10]